MPMKCSMNMLWNTQIEGTCIVFRSWRVSGKGTLILSFLAIVALGVFYEYLKQVSKAYDQRVAKVLASNYKGKTTERGRSRSTSPGAEEDTELLSGGRLLRPHFGSGVRIPIFARIIRASLYALLIALSFFLMLIFMTYNSYLITAVVVGAGLGHYIFSPTMNIESVLANDADGRSMACH